MARILVIGASRGLGLETVRKALAEGFDVRALSRTADALPIQGERLEWVFADARDRSRLEAALVAIDAVIMTLGVAPSPAVLLGGTTLFSDSTRAVVEAMKVTGVRRLIVVTGLGAGDSRGHGGFIYDAILFPLLLKRVYDDKDVQEQMVRHSGLDWTIVRPGFLTRARDRHLPRPRQPRGVARRHDQPRRCGGIPRRGGAQSPPSREDACPYFVRRVVARGTRRPARH
jgi:nucleoside-diphosphate-sugar epimerase